MQQLLTRKSRWIAPGTIGRKNLHFDLSSFHGKLHTLVVDEIYLHTFGARSQLKCLQRMKCIWQRNLSETFSTGITRRSQNSLAICSKDNLCTTYKFKLEERNCIDEFMLVVQNNAFCLASEMLKLELSSSALCISSAISSHLINKQIFPFKGQIAKIS